MRRSFDETDPNVLESMDSIDEIADLLAQANAERSIESEVSVSTEPTAGTQASSSAAASAGDSKTADPVAIARKSIVRPTNEAIQLPKNIRNAKPHQSDVASTPQKSRSRTAPPMPNRPKGRGFLLLLFLIMFGCVGYFAFSAFLKVESFGIVDGQLVSVAAPWEGTVGRWLVREGDEVTQGQILLEINNLMTENQIDALGDELKLTQAELEAEMSKIRFNYREHDELNRMREQTLQSDLTRARGELRSETVKLRGLEREYKRSKKLAQRGSLSKEAYEKLLYEYVGQRKKVAALEETAELFKKQQTAPSIESKDLISNGSSQLKPILAKIDMTKAEILRLRKRLELGQLTAPCDGRITQRFCLTGEATSPSVPVVEILKNNSVEAVLYVPQKHTDEYRPGDKVEVILDPYPDPMECVVDRIGESYEPAPKNIARFYSHQQFLLPVHLKPDTASQRWMALRLNGTIRKEFDLQSGVDNAWNEGRSWIRQAFASIKKSYQSLYATSEATRDQ